MKSLFAKTALLPEGWAQNVLIDIDQNGWITSVKSAEENGADETASGPLLPGMMNTHSHAFQFAMAGLTERPTGKQDSFWTWRDLMYQFVDKIGPDEISTIAARLYMEMLKAGYTSVGEFHYLHHQPNGTPYEDKALLSRCLIETALKTGIGITHLPVLYECGGFGKKAEEGQKRFLNSPQALLDIINNLKKTYADNPQVQIGMAFHSLRAVRPESLTEMTGIYPVHIHIAEQMAEVNECVAHHGKRPVEYLLDTVNVDNNWSLVHASHMTDTEIQALANTGAVVAICPTTEANLGDGIFPLVPYLEQGGQFSIGSDSHISVNMVEELRWLEYGQRLFHQKRSIVSDIYQRALQGGAQSMDRAIGKIEKGMRADMIVLDPDHFMGKNILDAMIFASNNNPVKDVIVGGKWVVQDRQHHQEETIFQNYKSAFL